MSIEYKEMDALVTIFEKINELKNLLILFENKNS